jgi:hypothetical protein
MFKKIISIALTMTLMITSLTGCSLGTSKEEKEREAKIEKYENYLTENPITIDGKMMSIKYEDLEDDSVSSYVEMGSDLNNNVYFNMQMGNEESNGIITIYQINNDAYLYLKLQNEDGNGEQWYHTTTTSEESNELTDELFETDSIDEIFQDVVSCKYNSTITEGETTYDVIKVVANVTNDIETSYDEDETTIENNSDYGNDVDTIIENDTEEESTTTKQSIYLYVNTETEELEKIKTTEDGMDIIINIQSLENLTLPENIENIEEVDESDFALSLMGGIMAIAFMSTDGTTTIE